MSLPPAFQLALESFGLDRDTTAAKREIWALLSPIMPSIADTYLQTISEIAPYYRASINAHRARHSALIITSTERLFCDPFDERWVAATKERVEAEIALGFDLRNRGVVGQHI